MFCKQLLLHTELIYFYVRNGFKITYVHKFYEYEGARCFAKLHDIIYRARVEATCTNDNMRATAVKLVANSMYGIMLMVSLIFLKMRVK